MTKKLNLRRKQGYKERKVILPHWQIIVLVLGIKLTWTKINKYLELFFIIILW